MDPPPDTRRGGWIWAMVAGSHRRHLQRKREREMKEEGEGGKCCTYLHAPRRRGSPPEQVPPPWIWPQPSWIWPQSPSSSWTPQPPPPPRGGRGKAAVVDPRRVDPRHGEGGRKAAAVVRPDPSGTPWWTSPPPCWGGPCRRPRRAPPGMPALQRHHRRHGVEREMEAGRRRGAARRDGVRERGTSESWRRGSRGAVWIWEWEGAKNRDEGDRVLTEAEGGSSAVAGKP